MFSSLAKSTQIILLQAEVVNEPNQSNDLKFNGVATTMEKSSVFDKMKCGRKRNFDVAFLSGESEAEEFNKKPKEGEKPDEKSNLITNSKLKFVRTWQLSWDDLKCSICLETH